jgi:hypothetical protein
MVCGASEARKRCTATASLPGRGAHGRRSVRVPVHQKKDKKGKNVRRDASGRVPAHWTPGRVIRAGCTRLRAVPGLLGSMNVR